MPKLTRWFSPEEKPVRVGWYHTSPPFLKSFHKEIASSMYNRWWDGSKWKSSEDGFYCSVQDRYWRGLSEAPKKRLK